MKKNNVEQIIIENKLCITQNPQGLTKNWPKSYVVKFYESFFKNINFKTRIINFLDLDSKNKNQKILWEKLFRNLNLTQSKYLEFVNIKNKIYNYDFDVIVMNIIPSNNQKKIFENILNQLNNNGLLIIEDCGENIKFILKIFIIFSYAYDVQIEDYRLHRFLRNNCLLTIRKYKSSFIPNILTIYKNFLKIIYYLILEAILKIHDLISIELNK